MGSGVLRPLLPFAGRRYNPQPEFDSGALER
jgi:hypothetical protein